MVALRHLGRPYWAVFATPIITGVATLGVLATAATNQESEFLVNKATVMNALQDSPAPIARTYVGAFAAKDGPLQLKTGADALASGLFAPFPRDTNAMSSWALKVRRGGSEDVVELEMPSGSLGTMVLDGVRRMGGHLDTDLVTDGAYITGTITNNLGYRLADASLVLDFRVHRVGNLRPGETRQVEVPVPSAASAGFGLPNSFSSLLYPTSSTDRRGQETARRDLLDSIFGSTSAWTRTEMLGLTLVGWLDGDGLPLEAREARATVGENTVYLASLPVQLVTGREIEVPAPLIIRRYMGSAAFGRQTFGSYDLAAGESMALQFILPAPPGRFRLQELRLNVEGRISGRGAAQRNGPGRVSLLNWREGEWQEFEVAFGPNAIPQPERYVSAGGEVRVRYLFPAQQGPGPSSISLSRFDLSAWGVAR